MDGRKKISIQKWIEEAKTKIIIKYYKITCELNCIVGMNDLYVKDTKNKGKGVFAKNFIAKGTIIEQSPVLVIPAVDLSLKDQSLISNYVYSWNKDCALTLGYGSLYNHSYTPNAQYIRDIKNNLMLFRAIKDIEADEEVTINYNGDPKDKTKVWFEVKS